MLHEILLALSGHPSSLFPADSEKNFENSSEFINSDLPLLSPSEEALLETIANLARLHRQIREHAEKIISEHESNVCRAVAASLLHVHLGRFQRKIIDVESQMLTHNATLVGAYNIVPLSAVVGEFDEWTRRMQWYWNTARFIQSPSRTKASSATGAVLIDHLRVESQTGYPDVESAAIQLSQVAEKAWMKQVSVWLLYGALATHGSSDFFISMHASGLDGGQTYTMRRELLPKLVSRETAASLLFIGKSLHQVKLHRQTSSSRSSNAEDVDDRALLSIHAQMISSLKLPLISSAFSSTISAIRSSLSQKVLQRILPPEEIYVLLTTLYQFFLLKRSDFATVILSEAQQTLNMRQEDLGRFLQNESTRNTRGLLIKEGEVTETLARTWKTLVSIETDDLEDEILDFAREHFRLTITSKPSSRPSTADSSLHDVAPLSDIVFSDLLLPVQTSLTLDIPSPLDLFISHSDIARYSSITSYLLALRKSHTGLSDLWRLSSVRRGAPRSNPRSDESRARAQSRDIAMRKVWATCSAAVFLLSETSAYFEGEIIRGAWDHFFAWAIRGSPGNATDDIAQPTERNTVAGSHTTPLISSPKQHPDETKLDATRPHIPHDPESLSTGHRSFLSNLTHSLLLTDNPYTHTLRTFLSNVDQLTAHFSRLQQVQKHLDLDLTSGITSNFADEEQDTRLQLDRARKRVDSGMRDLVKRLREIDHERFGSGGLTRLNLGSAEGAFEPWLGGGVDRLLMKLDFGRVTDDELMFA